MQASNLRFALVTAAALGVVAVASPASARGCNGVVNPLVWGCAPWDNNNGPSFPNYRPPASNNEGSSASTNIRIPASHAQQFRWSQGNRQFLYQGRWYNLIGNDGGSLIGNDGASLIGNDGGSLRRRGW